MISYLSMNVNNLLQQRPVINAWNFIISISIKVNWLFLINVVEWELIGTQWLLVVWNILNSLKTITTVFFSTKQKLRVVWFVKRDSIFLKMMLLMLFPIHLVTVVQLDNNMSTLRLLAINVRILPLVTVEKSIVSMT